jgi:tetratricopeptide (TPR) repeat protein
MNNDRSRSNLFYHPLNVAVCLLLIDLLIYANTLSSPFIFDDYSLIVDNPRIMISNDTGERFTDLLTGPFANRPLAQLTFAFNYFFHRFDVVGFHVFNILIHFINAWLVFFLARQTFRQSGGDNDRAAFFAALIWIVSPIHTQSVTYIVQRMNSLAAMFYLICMICYIRSRRLQINGAGRIKISILAVGCLLAGLCGLASKEIVASLPPVILLYEWFFFQNLDRTWLRKHLVLIIPAIILPLLIALYFVGGNPLQWLQETYQLQPFTPAQRLLTQSRVIVYYLTLLVFPDPGRLILDYDFPVSRGLLLPATTVPAILSVAALIILAVVAAKKNRLLSFAICWFLGNLVIESSVIGLALIFEHRTYLPSIFPVIAVSALLLRPTRRARKATILICIFTAICGIWTWQRNHMWQEDTAIWQDCINKAPHNDRAWYNLGLSLELKGDYSRAIGYFHKSLDLNDCRLNNSSPGCADIMNSLGYALLETGHYEDAQHHFLKALEISREEPHPDPIYVAEVINNLGVAYFKSGAVDQALVQTRKAMAIRLEITGPNSLETAGSLNNLGMIYSRQQHYAQAGEYFLKALTIFRHKLGKSHVKTATTYNNLGMIEHYLGHPDQAEAYFRQALAIRIKTIGPKHPDTAETWNNLGVVYKSIGDNDKAAGCFERALIIFREAFGDEHPSTRATRHNLSGLEKTGESSE